MNKYLFLVLLCLHFFMLVAIVWGRGSMGRMLDGQTQINTSTKVCDEPFGLNKIAEHV